MASETGSSRLKQVTLPPEAEETTEKQSADAFLEQAGMQMLLLGLKTLSQKTLVAFGQLFTFLACGSAFVLWYSVLPNPNTYQLFGLALYAAFILLLHLVKRKA